MKEIPKFSRYYTNQNTIQKNQYFSNNQKKKAMLKPPFKKGLYSYKQSYNYIPKINNNNFFSYESPNYSVINIRKDKNNIININNTYLPAEHGNSSLSFSSLNLNKYKIPYFSMNNNNKGEAQRIINESSELIKNPNLSMNINTNMNLNLSNNKNNNLNDSNINIEYYDYFNDSRFHEKESRRMIIELFKLKLKQKKDGTGIKELLKNNKISLKVLNQKINEKDNEKYENQLNNNYNDNNDKEVFGEAKKQVYLKNLDYYHSPNSTVTTEIINTNHKAFNIENNYINSKNKKRINILNFLLTPRVLNLIEDIGDKKKFVFLISLDEKFYLEGKESYIFQWKNMENNEAENEFNIKLIQNCDENKIFRNRFSLKVKNEELDENFTYEIETPSDEICNNYVVGINYLLSK